MVLDGVAVRIRARVGPAGYDGVIDEPYAIVTRAGRNRRQVVEPERIALVGEDHLVPVDGERVLTLSSGHLELDEPRRLRDREVIVQVGASVLYRVIVPGMDGIETFEQVRGIDPNTVVIMMTGYTAEDLIGKAISGGAYTCIHKPFDMEKVISIVESIVG